MEEKIGLLAEAIYHMRREYIVQSVEENYIPEV